jgi:serine phosphatase RsbU (regulator of sigma subunit)
MKKRLYILSICLLLIPLFKASAQSRKIDSLKRVLLQKTEDTSRFLIAIKICIECNYIGAYGPALDYGNKALELAKTIESSSDPKVAAFGKKAESRSYINMGNVYENLSNFAQARAYYTKGLYIKQEIKDKKGIADAFNNIGLTYEGQSDYPQALDYFFRSLSAYTEINNKSGMALTYSNIGTIYLDEGNSNQAVGYYQKSMKIRDSLGDKMGEADSYDNIALIYASQNLYLNALNYFLKSQKIREDVGFLDKMAFSYNNIANIDYILTDEKDSVKKRFINTYYPNEASALSLNEVNQLLLDSAWTLRTKALNIGEKIGDLYTVEYALKGIGQILQKRGEYAQSLSYLQKAVAIARKTNSKKEAFEILQDISASEFKLRKFDSSLAYYQMAMDIKDSIFSEEKEKAIGREEAKIDYEKKQALSQAENKRQLEREEEQRKRQQLIIYSSIAVLLMLAIFSILIAQRLRITRQQKSIIEAQKSKLDKAFYQLEDAKKMLEEKHKDLTDSIHYASRIQNALLTSTTYLDHHLPEHFIFFKPRDIVSGDFYWALKHKGLLYIACCDCTGHGVPGAFMSLLNLTFLHQTVIEKGINQPDKIFENIRANLIEALSQDGSGETKDGMDAVLCSIDFEKHILKAACANNPLWIIRDKEFIEFKADKIPIGEGLESKSFTLHETQLKKGDCIYMFSDGYADQFGGVQGKKYKQAQLKDFLLSIHQKTMREQGKLIEEEFNRWKGFLDQVDDVCVIGLRV